MKTRPGRSSLLVGMVAGGALVLAGMALGGAGRQADAEVAPTLRARQIEIVDEIGTVQLVVGTNAHGGTISIRDRLGRTVLLSGATEHGGMIVASSRETWQPSLVAGAFATGGAVQLFDRAGRQGLGAVVTARGGELNLVGVEHKSDATSIVVPALQLTVDEAGSGAVHARGPDGKQRFRLFSDGGGSGVIETYQRDTQRPLVSLASTVGGHGQIKTTAPNGQPLIIMTATATDEGQIYTYDGTGRPLVAVASRSTGPSLRVFNRNGVPAVTLESDGEGHGTVGVWKTDGTGRMVGADVKRAEE